MAKAMHIPNAARYIALKRSGTQPWVILHELTHAYHDRVLGFEVRRNQQWEVGAGLERVDQCGNIQG